MKKKQEISPEKKKKERKKIIVMALKRMMGQATHLRSAKPPPEAQLSLKGREVLGMGVPLTVKAFAAAAGEEKSTKQYPALLL